MMLRVPAVEIVVKGGDGNNVPGARRFELPGQVVGVESLGLSEGDKILETEL